MNLFLKISYSKRIEVPKIVLWGLFYNMSGLLANVMFGEANVSFGEVIWLQLYRKTMQDFTQEQNIFPS